MSRVIKIKQGKDINIKGRAPLELMHSAHPTIITVSPQNWRNLVPKLSVKEGEEVKAGDPIFTDKTNEAIVFAAPVSGEVVEIVRGERRLVLGVKILADKEISYKSFSTDNFKNKTKEEITSLLLEGGLWPFIVQRPFGVIANPLVAPKAIFVSGFDSAPLSQDYNFALQGEENNLQTGLDVLAKLTSGKVHLSLHQDKANTIYDKIQGVEKNWFSGPHPSGLVGVQIHHLDPINKGEVVWTVNIQHVAFIGRFFNTGKLDLKQNIVLCGSAIEKRGYVNTIVGADIKSILSGNSIQAESRLIDGNVLTGTQSSLEASLGFFNQQLTAIPEGKEFEFLGWLFPSYARPTISNSLPISKFLTKEFEVNANFHGEERAFVVTGQYDKVLPMDVLPVHLLKAIMANDIDKMENLGIYEVIEEDMALCEFACTSKIEVQQIISEGIDLMISES